MDACGGDSIKSQFLVFPAILANISADLAANQHRMLAINHARVHDLLIHTFNLKIFVKKTCDGARSPTCLNGQNRHFSRITEIDSEVDS